MRTSFLSTKSEIGLMRLALLRLYADHQAHETLPTSARFLYYELIANETISKTDEGAYNRVIRALTDLREKKHIKWDDIVDETRTLTEWATYPSIAEGLKQRWQHAKLDLWEGKPCPVIICESRSLSGILESLALEYQASIMSTVGQVAGILHTTLGPALARGHQRVFYLGDADFSGGHIERNTRRVLEEIIGRKLRWERVAITDHQIKKYDLTVIKKKDMRDHKYHPSVETEALGQARIIRLLRRELDDLLPMEQRNRVLAKEKKQRQELGFKLEYLRRFPRYG